MIGFLTQIVQDVPLPQPENEIWLRYGVNILVLVGGFLASYYAFKVKLAEIKSKVDTAVKLAEPTGNGFAAKTIEGQKEILAAVVRLSDRVDEQGKAMTHHLEHHIDREHT